MKKIFLLFAVALLIIACYKDDEAPQPTPEPTEIEKLPPATQTGANKVGCLVNGKAFLPEGQLTGSSNPYCGYFHDAFSLVFNVVKNNDNITANGTESVVVYSSNTFLEEGNTYVLQAENSDHSGGYRVFDRNDYQFYDTNDEYIGELHITKLDKTNNVISGTFWFDAVNEQSKKVEIREGRFDMVFEGWAG
ncbi:DUF6252 family protein [Paenimyroides aestuarii]|uniref:DUF6252 family protein n=1 Tax=Paenimyroides aestuarii TaxID=2968490 RepID=A0ABY5NUQ2_9FLAO|nr:DUF6252 family protein [Paenimyroides aestuarii]UUV22122.1 DUF6252 family protein [Paenimyroides aestuarii]